MVNPGFAGQKVVRSTLKKVAKPKGLLKKQGYEEIIIEVDGNISPENGRKLRECRASIFVGGTSSIFKGSVSNL